MLLTYFNYLHWSTHVQNWSYVQSMRLTTIRYKSSSLTHSQSIQASYHRTLHLASWCYLHKECRHRTVQEQASSCQDSCRSRQTQNTSPHSRQILSWPCSHHRQRHVMMWQLITSNTHTHTRLTALCPGLLGWASTRKVKPIWSKRQWVAVATAGPCTSLHLAPDR